MTNLDALYLRQLARDLSSGHLPPPSSEASNAIQAHLLRIADNLQRMDEANAILAANRTYEQGVADAEARIYARSNVLQDGPSGEQLTGGRIIDSLTSVKVTKVPTGFRALEDKPDKFNAPFRRKAPVPEPKAEAQKPSIALDLSFLEDL